MRTVGAGTRTLATNVMGVAMDEDENDDRYGHSEERGCPDWCMECLHDVGPDGAFWHKGPPHTIDVYGEREGSVLVPLVVRAEYFDKLPEDRGPEHDVPDLEVPIVRIEVDADGVDLSLTPGRARQLAAALISAADTITGAPQPSSV
jgi:hypothetical protein